jgi:hypothetical protein
MSRVLRKLALVAVLVVFAASAHGVTLDWDQNAWAPTPTPAPNVTSSAFDIDANAAGSDVTITATATAGSAWQASLPAPNPMTPVVSRAFDGGLSPGQNSLELSVDFGKQNGATNDSITVTINFSTQYEAVSNVSFTLFDIDYANGGGSTYEDKISNIVATTTTGGSLASTITGVGSSVSKTGTGLTQVLTGIASNTDTGPTSGNGNATISFIGNNIRSISFTYAPGASFNDPTYQHIGLFDISYTPVPEINPAFTAALSCVAAAFLIRRHRTNVRKRQFQL